MGTLFKPDEEAVADLDPDLVIVAKRSADAYESLSARFPTIDMSVTASSASTSSASATDGATQQAAGGQPSATVTDTLTSYATILGTAFNTAAQAQAEVADFTSAAAEVAALGRSAGKGLVLMTSGGAITAFGPGSRFDVIYNEFGVEAADPGIEPSTNGQSIDFEFIGQKNPDLLFVLDRDAAIGQEGASAEEILNNELVTGTNAWKSGKVFYLDGANWYLLGAGFNVSQTMAEEIKTDLSA